MKLSEAKIIWWKQLMNIWKLKLLQVLKSIASGGSFVPWIYNLLTSFSALCWRLGNRNGIQPVKSCFSLSEGSPLKAFRRTSLTWSNLWKNNLNLILNKSTNNNNKQ